jgi:hypothetical protein
VDVLPWYGTCTWIMKPTSPAQKKRESPTATVDIFPIYHPHNYHPTLPHHSFCAGDSGSSGSSNMNNYPLRSKKRAEGQVWDLTLDSSGDDDEVVKDPNKKSRRRRKSKQTSQDDDVTATQPELVPSSGNHPSETAFDEEDFEELRRRYLLPRIQLNSELPTGMTLRRTCRARLIDLKTPGFQRLRVRIDELTKKNDTMEVYRLLCQVRSYEINPSRVPQIMQERNQDGDVTEVFDLTQDNDDDNPKECFNVDEYITDVLLPQDDTVSRPDCVVSTNVKSEKNDNDAILSPKRECIQEEQPPESENITGGSVAIEAQETPLTPMTTLHVAQVTPEKPLDLSSVAVVTRVSASTSRSSTPSDALQMPVKSMNNSVRNVLDCEQSECNQAVRGTQILQMTLPKNVLEQVYRMKGRNRAIAKRSSLLDSESKALDRDVLIGTAKGKMNQRNVCVFSVSVMPSERVHVLPSKPSMQCSLAKEWRSQTRRRRHGGEFCPKKC